MNCKSLMAVMLAVVLGAGGTYAQSAPGIRGEGPQKQKTVKGQRKYKLVVNEGNDSTVAEFNRGLESMRGNLSNRGFLDNLAGLYKKSAAGQAVSITSNLLNFGLNAIISATKSKKPEWEKAVRGECTFVRRLPMQMEILDFYRQPSTNGPLDPTDMNFNGFGCKQFIEYVDPDGNVNEEEVFYVTCKVKTGPEGKARMLNHSKFEMEIDTLRFNYALCDLPNDSLGMATDKRIGFSFDNRKDLKFVVNAAITSSWINQALMVFNDQPLGSFEIVASIDPKYIDSDGVFRYYADRDRNSGKDVRISGECFLVPRSYVGSSDMKNIQDSWGTGQYKVEMKVSEVCKINERYYMTADGKDNNKWKEEWALIKKRKKQPSIWQQLLGVVSSQYKDSKWVTVLAEPAVNAFIQYETEGITRLLNTGTSAPAGVKAGGASGASGAAGAGGAGGTGAAGGSR